MNCRSRIAASPLKGLAAIFLQDLIVFAFEQLVRHTIPAELALKSGVPHVSKYATFCISFALASWGSQALGQLPAFVGGTVVDAETGAPIPYAMVQLVGARSGTLCNLAGAFRIELTDVFPTDTLRFDALGYAGQALPLARLPKRSEALTIRLESAELTIDPVVIRSQDPWQLIQTALARYEANHWIRPFGVRFLFREFAEDAAHRPLHVHEAVVEAGISADLTTDPVFALVQQRFATDTVRYAETGDASGKIAAEMFDTEIRSTYYTLTGSNLRKHGVFSPKGGKVHTFTLVGTREYAGTQAYEITFAPSMPAKKAKYPQFTGRVLLAEDNLAFLAAQASLVQESAVYIRPGWGVRMLMKLMKFAYQIDGLDSEVWYRQSGDKWYPAGWRATGGIAIARNKRSDEKRFDLHLGYSRQWITTSVLPPDAVPSTDATPLANDAVLEAQPQTEAPTAWTIWDRMPSDVNYTEKAAQIKAANAK